MTTALAILFALLPAESKAEPRRLRAWPIEGEPRVGLCERWTPLAGLTLTANEQSAKPPIEAARELSIVRALWRPEPPRDMPWRLVTTDDQVACGNILGGDGETIRFELSLGPRISLPLERVRLIERRRGPAGPPPAAGASDRLWLANGDLFDGLVTAVSDESLMLAPPQSDEPRAVAWAVIGRVVFASAEPSPDEADRATGAWLHLADGSRWRIGDWDWHGNRLTVAAWGETALEVPLGAFRALEPAAPQRRWLSRLDPANEESRPILGPSWSIGRDRACIGRPLRAGGREYERGLGLHAGCRVVWNLEEPYRRFAAVAAIDDSAGSLADAALVFRVDGREVARIDALTRAAGMQPVEADLRDARTFEIEVLPGRFADVDDRIDLLDARLIRE